MGNMIEKVVRDKFQNLVIRRNHLLLCTNMAHTVQVTWTLVGRQEWTVLWPVER